MNHDWPDDLLARLHTAFEPDPGTAADAALKRRLLQSLAVLATPQHLTVPAGPEGWQPLGPGLRIKRLYEADGVLSYLVQMEAGASLPAHRHPVDEECLVLAGEVCVGALCVGAGGYHRGRRGLPHERLHSAHGALLFLRGAVPDAALLL